MPPLLPLLLAFGLAFPAASGRSPSRPAPAQDPVAERGPFRDLALADALEAARGEDRIVLVEFSTAWSEDGKRLAGETWSDPRVRAWIGVHAVAVRVDGDRHGELARSHRIRGYPTVLLLEPTGGEIHRVRGFFTAGDFLAALEERMGAYRELLAARDAVAAAPGDPRAHLRLAHALKRYPQRQVEVLDALLLAWETGAEDDAFQEVRLRSLPGEIGAMLRTQPGASPALERLREGVSARLLAPAPVEPEGAGEAALEEARALWARRLRRHAEELVALNGVLVQPGSTLAAYDLLRARGDAPPSVLAVLLDESVIGLLLQQKRYADVVDGLGDVVARVEARMAALQARRLAGEPAEARAVMVEGNLAVAEAARYFQALVGAGRAEQAADLRELVLALEPTSHCYLALINASLAAGDAAGARALVERGRKSLPELEARRLMSLVQRVDLSGK